MSLTCMKMNVQVKKKNISLNGFALKQKTTLEMVCYTDWQLIIYIIIICDFETNSTVTKRNQ